MNLQRSKQWQNGRIAEAVDFGVMRYLARHPKQLRDFVLFEAAQPYSPPKRPRGSK